MMNVKKTLSLLLALAMCLSLLAGCASSNTGDNDSSDSNDTYTYRFAQSYNNTTWNMHDTETTDTSITPYTEMNLWVNVLNDNADGLVWVDEMADGDPVDVTTEYAGDPDWGIPADATEGYAWKVTLNPNACWEDGTPIDADSYVYSMSQALNPEMNNYAASYWYTKFPIYNAENYYKSGDGAVMSALADVDSGEFADVSDDATMYISFTQPTCAFWGYSAADYYYDDYVACYVNEAGEDLYEKYAGQDYVEVTDEVIADINYMLVNGWGWTEDPNNYLYMAFYEGEAATWDQVGFFKTGDYEITVILYNPLSEFFFKYYAENFGLVNEEKYEAGKTQTGDMIKTDYATSVDTYMSYGPYKLVSYQADKEFRLTRNENWYGWTDGKHDGLYQTTDIVGSIITDTTTQELLFLQGQLDALTLTADNLSNYQGSDYMVYLTTATLYYLNINNDLEALTEQQSDGVNMTILTNAEFRKGISLAINRSEYVAQMGYGAPLYGYFNNSFLADVDSGEVYRSSEAGENVLKTFYGVSDVSEITGYDLAAARECLVAGYEQAVADGLVKETDRFEFAFPTWDQETSSVRQVTFMQNALDAATEGTVLEGRITVKMVVSENYYSMLDSGEYGICISGWIGDEYNPYVLMQDFVTGDNAAQSLLGFDPYTETLDIELSGETVTHTYYDWYDLLCNGEYSLADSDVRNQILSQMELSLLQMYRDCPFYSSSSAVLLSMKTNYPTYEPVMGNNLGGLRRMTYNYTDAEWETYCAANNNQLNYN